MASQPKRGPESAAVEVRDLVVRYGSRRALDGVTFEVAEGNRFALLGPNGSGKSTLFRVLSTLHGADGGSARVFGLGVDRAPSRVRGLLGVVFQAPSLDRKLTVRENLTHQGHLYGLWGRNLARRIDELLERFGLADRARDRVETLSGGLARRVEIAKGLLHRPRLLLLDEPSTGLDPAARAELRRLLETLSGEGITILLTTHLMEEADACHRLVLLNEGRLVAEGTPERLKAEIGGEVVWLEGNDPEELARDVGDRLSRETRVVDGRVRLEGERGAELLTQAVEAFPGRIRAATLSRPTLEDVFFQRTGSLFTAEASS